MLLREIEDVPSVEFVYLVFTRMPGESYRKRFRSLLLCPLSVQRPFVDHVYVKVTAKCLLVSRVSSQHEAPNSVHVCHLGGLW